MCYVCLGGDAADRSHDLQDRLSLCFHNFISSHPFGVIVPSGVALILSRTSRVLSALLPLIQLLLGFYVSFRHVISVRISSSLPVPFCCFRFNDIPAPSFHFDILYTPASLRSIYEHIPGLHSPYLSLPYLDLPLLLFRAFLSVCICSFSPSHWVRHARGRDQPEMLNCLFLTAQRSRNAPPRPYQKPLGSERMRKKKGGGGANKQQQQQQKQVIFITVIVWVLWVRGRLGADEGWRCSPTSLTSMNHRRSRAAALSRHKTKDGDEKCSN